MSEATPSQPDGIVDPTDYEEGDPVTVKLPRDVWEEIRQQHPDCPQEVPATVIDTDGGGHHEDAVPVMVMLPNDDHHLDAFLPSRLSMGV